MKDMAMSEIKIILRAVNIPDKSVVTKKTGTKEFVLRKSISVYIAGEEKQDIKAEGSVFLIDNEGNINSFDWNKELLWRTTYNKLYQFLKDNDYSEEDYYEEDGLGA